MPSLQDRLHKDERHRQQRRRRRIAAASLILVVLLLSWYIVSRPSFAFGDIVVSGSSLITRQDILRISGNKEPVNLFRISRRQLLKCLKNDVRVADATGSYGWGILYINVVERKPVLYLKNAYKNYVKVDEHGLVLDIGSGIKDASVPLCAGVSCGSVYVGDVIAVPQVKEVLDFVRGLTDEARSQISEIVVDPGGKVQVSLKYGFPVYLGTVDGIKDKSSLFMTVFDEIHHKQVRAQYIDLQYAKPYIKLK